MHEQGTAEWITDRLGKVTASRIADVMAKTKSGYGAGRKNYMAELVVERLTGEPTEHFISSAMQHGTETEPIARGEYEAVIGDLVTEAGLIDHPSIRMSGASPDGLVGDDGLVEIKCPNTATHIAFLFDGKIGRQYILQMQWQMDCTGRAWCDFVSFDSRMPENLRMKIVRIARDESLLAEIRKEVQIFLVELDDMIVALENLNA